LRRFAVGLIKSKPVRSVAQTMRQLNRNMRLIFDSLLMAENSPRASGSHAGRPENKLALARVALTVDIVIHP
jgi:hypothetical protein